MIHRRSAKTVDLELQVLFVWEPDQAPTIDGVVLDDWESVGFYVPGGALFTLMCDLPDRAQLRPVVGTVLSDWAKRAATVRARISRGRDRLRLSDGDTDVTLALRSAVVEAHRVN